MIYKTDSFLYYIIIYIVSCRFRFRSRCECWKEKQSRERKKALVSFFVLRVMLYPGFMLGLAILRRACVVQGRNVYRYLYKQMELYIQILAARGGSFCFRFWSACSFCRFAFCVCSCDNENVRSFIILSYQIIHFEMYKMVFWPLLCHILYIIWFDIVSNNTLFWCVFCFCF